MSRGCVSDGREHAYAIMRGRRCLGPQVCETGWLGGKACCSRGEIRPFLYPKASAFKVCALIRHARVIEAIVKNSVGIARRDISMDEDLRLRRCEAKIH